MEKEQIQITDLAVSFADRFVATETSYKKFVTLEKKATTALYTFLGEVFEVYKDFKTTKDRTRKEQDSLLQSFGVILEERKAARKVTYTGATSLETKLIRFVCGGDVTEGREKAWAKCLKFALKDTKVVSGEVSFALWLAGQGGVGEVGKTTKSGEKPAEKTERFIQDAKDYFSTVSETEFDKAFEGRELEACEIAPGFCVALVYEDEEGKRLQYLKMTDKALVKSALSKAGKIMEDFKVKSKPLSETSVEIDDAVEEALADIAEEQMLEVV